MKDNNIENSFDLIYDLAKEENLEELKKLFNNKKLTADKLISELNIKVSPIFFAAYYQEHQVVEFFIKNFKPSRINIMCGYACTGNFEKFFEIGTRYSIGLDQKSLRVPNKEYSLVAKRIVGILAKCKNKQEIFNFLNQISTIDAVQRIFFILFIIYLDIYNWRFPKDPKIITQWFIENIQLVGDPRFNELFEKHIKQSIAELVETLKIERDDPEQETKMHDFISKLSFVANAKDYMSRYGLDASKEVVSGPLYVWRSQARCQPVKWISQEKPLSVLCQLPGALHFLVATFLGVNNCDMDFFLWRAPIEQAKRIFFYSLSAIINHNAKEALNESKDSKNHLWPDPPQAQPSLSSLSTSIYQGTHLVSSSIKKVFDSQKKRAEKLRKIYQTRWQDTLFWTNKMQQELIKRASSKTRSPIDLAIERCFVRILTFTPKIEQFQK